MNKSSKMVSLFLATAIVLSTAGCSTAQKVVYDKDGNPIIQEDDSDQGFFGGFFAPFGFSRGRSHGASSGFVRPSGVSSGNSVTPENSGTSKSNTGISGVSPWGRSGSTSTSGGSSSSGGTGITSGSHGGIGGGGSSAS